jgi:FkbM family methyltransferase
MTYSQIYKKTVDGFKWILDISDNGIGRTLWNSNTDGKGFSFSRECAFMSIINDTVKPGMVCIDLGANIGYATMIMLRNTGPDGFVYAIEPDQHNLKYLTLNINENDFLDESRVKVERCLISDHDGESSFWIARQPNLNSVKKTKNSIREENISCNTLGTFCSKRQYPNFIKMDIEGHEVSVFEGGYEYFKENHGETHILLEVHPSYYNEDNDFAQILEKYFDIGFKCSYIVATPVPNPGLFIKMGYKPEHIVKSDGFVRGLYKDIKNEHAIQITCRENLEPWNGGYTKKIARSMMISRKK